MFNKVIEVKPLTNYQLAVLFLSGEKRLYDVKPLLNKWESFKALSQTDSLFQQVKVDQGGYGISWNDDIDLACDELYYFGVPI